MHLPITFRTVLLALALSASVVSARGQAITVRYREAADAFEILDNVSAWWPDFTESAYRTFWRDSIGITPADSALFVRYAQLREKYYDKSGQGNTAPRRDGSGLFSDRATLRADPVAAAFYAAESTDAAILSLRGVLTADELGFLTRFYAHFYARLVPLLAQTKTRTAASLAVTAGGIAAPDVGLYMTSVRRLFGIDTAPPFTALYVWWSDTAQIRANPSGRFLLLRARPATGDTINSADVVAHEAIHVYAALSADAQKQALSSAVLDRCTPPPGVSRLAVLEEPIATALGNIEFRRRFQPRRFSWGRRWYGDPWVDLSSRLLYPVLMTALADGKVLDAGFSRDAGALCALQVRARGDPTGR
jgi:hypothetical protein